jgi:hypothetical protein
MGLMRAMRMVLDILRALVLATLVFQTAAPVAAAPGDGLRSPSCLGAISPLGNDAGDPPHAHAACWSCCTAPALFAPPALPARACAPHRVARSFGAPARPKLCAMRRAPPARGPPAAS